MIKNELDILFVQYGFEITIGMNVGDLIDWFIAQIDNLIIDMIEIVSLWSPLHN